jgi:hypothetical protein
MRLARGKSSLNLLSQTDLKVRVLSRSKNADWLAIDDRRQFFVKADRVD